MTQRPNGRGPIPAKDVVNIGDLLPQEQCVKALKPTAAAEENLPDWAQCAPESAPNTATRLSNVLSLVEQHWMLTGRPISPVEVAEEMPDELGNNGRQKAFQALDALYRKRLLEKIKRSDGKRGTVAVFQPLKERRCSKNFSKVSTLS